MLHVRLICRGSYHVVFIPCEVSSKWKPLHDSEIEMLKIFCACQDLLASYLFHNLLQAHKNMYKNGNSFVFARSLITCFYHIKYIWYHFLPRRPERKVVVVSLLLGFTVVFESRDYSAALIKAAMAFFLQWMTKKLTPSRNSFLTISFIKV